MKYALIGVCLLFGWFGSLNPIPSSEEIASPIDQSKSAPSLEDALSSLRPTEGRSALLLGFDTDKSDDAKGYSQFYDDFEKQKKKEATNKTLLIVRHGDNLRIASSLDLIASPQASGWLYLGQARYFEPKPRDKNEYLDGLEEKGTLKNFGFDYTRVWAVSDRAKIPENERQLIRKAKSEIDREYRKLSKDEREYQRNMTDYEKLGWVSDGFYIADGYWSVVHGGAAWFEASENSRLVKLGGSRVSGNLSEWVAKNKIIETYKSDFDSTRRNDPAMKSNDMDAIWKMWLGSLSNNYSGEVPTFTLERHNAKTTLQGRVLVDGNTHRSFMLSADFGNAPKKLAKYDNPPIDFEKFKKLYPELIDVYVSPDQNTVVALTDKELIGIDVGSKKEISRVRHDLVFNKVIMVEWATGDYVEKWIKTLE